MRQELVGQHVLTTPKQFAGGDLVEDCGHLVVPEQPVQHIAFEFDSREEWLSALDHVRSCGVEIVDGPLVHGHEATSNQSFVGGSGSHAFYFLDPDGNRIEFYCWMMKVSRPTVAAPKPDLP